ncbi:SAV_6107 family HEPN domain-containing protein [Corynebacterium sp. 21KM1197]|nr:SAV_6107 family HEPN domain-containing protein [Corynebacterium sp. 21KM1197]WPF67947.1 SAV_6107 family HEPN domain-containing protein [Corynebacterium sp. 21KM1197]
MDKARGLLAQALAENEAGQYGEAFESAYRCALRVAGAVQAGAPVARRRRAPGGAWARLRLVDGRGGYWADRFEAFSRLRSRWNSGLESRIEEQVAHQLLDLASAFLAEVEAEPVALAAAA